ncbi:hypothetical protein DPQ22_04150 [Candidatus Tokpelaia sp.]|nr:hypothetical protein DPQ22_04150 [Candidatus Tokpelaia sp.]
MRVCAKSPADSPRLLWQITVLQVPSWVILAPLLAKQQYPKTQLERFLRLFVAAALAGGTAIAAPGGIMVQYPAGLPPA